MEIVLVDNQLQIIEPLDHDDVGTLSLESDKPLYELLSVDFHTYIHIPLPETKFDRRAYNCLRIGKRRDGSSLSCQTVGDVLQLSPLELCGFKNMGRLSVERTIAFLEKFVSSDVSNYINNEPIASIPEKRKYLSAFAWQVKSVLEGKGYSASQYKARNTTALARCMASSEIIGKEMAIAAINGEQTIFDIIHMFEDYENQRSAKSNRVCLLDSYLGVLPEALLNLPVEPFLRAYQLRLVEGDDVFTSDLHVGTTVKDYFRTILNNHRETESVINFALPFCRWLNFDINTLFLPKQTLLDRQKNSAIYILKQRIQGVTLTTIGQSLGVSRERVRQIERKIVERLTQLYMALRKDHDVLATLYAYRGGVSVFQLEDVAEVLGEEDAQIIWFLAKKGYLDCELYKYSQAIDAVVFGDRTSQDEWSSIFSDFPRYIKESEVASYLTDASERFGVPMDILDLHFRSTYKLEGTFYYRGRFTITFVCDYILRTNFPNGFKIADKSYYDLFISFMTEIFGKRKTITERALEAKMNQVGVLIDRGKYAHPSYIDVDQSIVDDVNRYIEESPRVVLTYKELFDTFAEQFKGTQITNRYFLQGVLKQFGCPFFLRKDYVSKDPDVNMASEFEAFIQQNGRVHKSALLEEFNGFSEINLGLLCQQLPEIVLLSDGYYMHASHLDITGNDRERQRELLIANCSDAPVSSRVLFAEFQLKFPDFLIRNQIESHANLFGVLLYMFRDEFYFSRPYISLRNDVEMTNSGVLLQLLSDIDSIEIDKLAELCKRNHIKFPSLRITIDAIHPEFLRCDENLLIRKELVGIDDDCILETIEQVKNIINRNDGYIASKNIKDFSGFPELAFPWNAYLLESVTSFAGDLLTVLKITTSALNNTCYVYVGDDFTDEDINSLIVRVLRRKSLAKPFDSKAEVFSWLQEQGLCNTTLPAFLEAEGHLSYDNNGRVTVK